MSDDTHPLAADVGRVYRVNAARFDAERTRDLWERVWLDRFTARLPPGGRVLDAGCGAGEPIAGHLIAAGFRVTGLDASAPMLALARSRWPNGDWREGDMAALDLPERFDGILGWNSFFHLTPDAQRRALAAFAGHLRPGGVLLLTVGPEAGERIGRVGDEPVYHASLAPEDYRDTLARLGLTVLAFVAEDPACRGQTVLMAGRH